MSILDNIGNAVQSARSKLDSGPSLLDAFGQPAGQNSPAIDLVSTWSKSSSVLPYADTLTAIDPFFNWQPLTAQDFRKLYNYELVITSKGSVKARLSLPLAPSHITMSTPLASSVSATMKGIVEDNNGAPFRDITISGTTGVLPADSLEAPKSVTNSALDYLFKNTIQAVGRVQNSINQAVNAFSGSPQSFTSKINFKVGGADEANAAAGSGYAFFHNLARFLDYYTAIKKTKKGMSYRLSFHMHKDQMYYDVLLSGWNWTKAPGTLEYQYGINLKAYRRKAHANETRRSQEFGFTQANRINALASVINGLKKSRAGISNVSGVLAGIRADVNDSFFGPLREITLLASDGLGLAHTVADFPQTLISQLKNSIMDLGNQFYNAPGQADFISKVENYFKGKNLFGSASDQPLFLSSINATNVDGKSSLSARPATSSPIEKVFQNVNAHLEFFDFFNLSDLRLTPDLNNLITQEIDRVRSLTSVDLRNRRDTIQAFVETVSESFGGGSATYNRVKGLPPPVATSSTLTVESIALLSQLNDTIQALDKTIVIMENADPDPTNDYYNFYADYALASGINFNLSQSKFFIPFPDGASLESLAFQYLGDPDRWIEIAALNALKEPYIDEEGFVVPFLGSGSGTTITISNATNLYVGQIVELSSDVVRREKRKIAAVDILSSIEAIIEFEGKADLSRFLVNDNAKMKAFLPNTVNSLMVIAIPTDAPPNITGSTALYPTVADLNGIARMAKVDFLLQSNGDLAFTSNGDVKLAAGMTNLVQAATMKVMTPLNSMLQHLGYGNPIQAGNSVADFSAQESLAALSKQFSDDPRFNGVAAGRITVQGPGVKIDLGLKIADVQALLPLSANLPL